MVNKIPVHGEGSKLLLRFMFDDPDYHDEIYMEHDEVRFTMYVHVDKREAHSAVDYLARHGHTLPFHRDELIGDWICECCRSDSNGIYWDEALLIQRAVKRERVITEWVPVNETVNNPNQ